MEGRKGDQVQGPAGHPGKTQGSASAGSRTGADSMQAWLKHESELSLTQGVRMPTAHGMGCPHLGMAPADAHAGLRRS